MAGLYDTVIKEISTLGFQYWKGAKDPRDGTVYFGTKHGDMRIRFHNAEPSWTTSRRGWLRLAYSDPCRLTA